MKIEMNTIYHLLTQAHEDDFLRQAEKQGLTWSSGTPALKNKHWTTYKEEHCVRVSLGRLDGWDSKRWFIGNSSLPIIEWKIGFTKADMQIGQLIKTRQGNMCFWNKSFEKYATDDLKDINYASLDIVEVYPMEITPIWKREEPKYRVKTELTKEQAEKLGLEFCEEVKDGTF